MDLAGLIDFRGTRVDYFLLRIPGIEWKTALEKNTPTLLREETERLGVTRLFVCDVCATIVSLARPQFLSGCWRSRPRLPITQSACALRRDSASCRDRGTARRCAPRCRLESAVLF